VNLEDVVIHDWKQIFFAAGIVEAASHGISQQEPSMAGTLFFGGTMGVIYQLFPHTKNQRAITYCASVCGALAGATTYLMLQQYS
jgi:hypothetical protein